MLDCDAVFAELEALGAVPFTTMPDADTRHGREIWEAANEGEYGTIAEYVPPPIEQVRASMPELSARQIRLAFFYIGANEAAVDAALTDPVDIIEWKHGTQFNRAHPLIDAIAAAFSLEPEHVDALWLWAAEL